VSIFFRRLALPVMSLNPCSAPWAGPGGEAAALQAVQWGLAIFGVVSFVALQFETAPYGRFEATGSRWYGPRINGRVAWVLQEAPNVWFAGLYLLYCPSRAPGSLPNAVLLGMFLLHYLQRTFVFPLLIRGGKPTPLVVFLMAAAFCAANGYLQSCYLMRVADYPEGYLTSPRFLVGAALFLFGMAVNLHSDQVLRSLRPPGSKAYHIPRGGAFEYVSAANYFGELVEWAGWAVACGTPAAWVFVLTTASNLVPRARQTHAWYRATFGDKYPAARRAVIPFLW
jgi:3-oxo-5-alpha-steroid 4-dehydrogenase 1